MLKGAECSARKAQKLGKLNQLTQNMPVIYVSNIRLCEHYAIQFTQLKDAETPIGANDL